MENLMELVQIALGWFVAVALGIVLFCGVIIVVGLMIDSRAEHDQQHDACLKQATNGYEIRQCH